MPYPALNSPLVLASHNAGKLRELSVLLAPLGLTIITAAQFGVDEPEETGDSYAANAALKAHHSARATGHPALADDSGLSVAALGGAPGIYSARWAGASKDFYAAMQRVKHEIEQKGLVAEGQPASFHCALALAWPDGALLEVEGRVDGTLTFPPRGEKGFGYDPIFIPTGSRDTYGEIDPQHKESTSHRARAFAQLVAALEPLLRKSAS